jgi:hypothetical protein
MAEVDFGASDATRASNRARFELELEFVQSLANPFYLHSLGLRLRSVLLHVAVQLDLAS